MYKRLVKMPNIFGEIKCPNGCVDPLVLPLEKAKRYLSHICVNCNAFMDVDVVDVEYRESIVIQKDKYSYEVGYLLQWNKGGGWTGMSEVLGKSFTLWGARRKAEKFAERFGVDEISENI